MEGEVVEAGTSWKEAQGVLRMMIYQGVVQECHCKYGVASNGDELCVVFVQGAGSYTSITNMIEHLASAVLKGDASGMDPKKVRFFEYYPPELRPMIEWQEVVFKESWEIWPEGLFGKWLAKATGKKPNWGVGSPMWAQLNQGEVPGCVRQMVV